MQYLNIIYFLIITFYGVKFLRTDTMEVRGALVPDRRYSYSGPELFWCLTFSTGVIALSLNVGLDLMALRLLVLEILCVFGMSISQNRPVVSGPLKVYIAYLVWIAIGIFYSPAPAYGVRVELKYLYPILLCLFASAAVRDSEVFFKSSLLARKVGVVAVICIFTPFSVLLFPGVLWYGTAQCIFYISITTFSLGMFFFTNQKKKNLFYILLFLAPCFFFTLRTSIMGSGVAIMAFFLIKYKLKSLPIIGLVLVTGVVIVFTVPSIRQKMFYEDNVTIEDFREGRIKEDNVNTNYRKVMWEKLDHMFFENHPVIGNGTGAVQSYMYSHRNEFGGLSVPHSDFIQQKCDNGLIGLYLYGAMILFIFVDCFKTYWRYENPALRLCAIVAGASLLGVYATFYSDNTVNYSMATLTMPFGFYGMMLGMRQKIIEEEGL